MCEVPGCDSQVSGTRGNQWECEFALGQEGRREHTQM